MHKNYFSYGPIAVGLFITLVALAPFVFVYWAQYVLHYLGFMGFLLVGLKPILIHTGLLRFVEALGAGFFDRTGKRSLAKRRRKIERKARDRKYRGARLPDERLPRNW